MFINLLHRDVNVNNYKLLPALASILKTKNLTDSARELNVTQSAMSKTLGQIRDAFHDPILIREGNRYILSQRAFQLAQQLPSLVSQLDDLFLPMQIDPSQCQRKFNVAFSSFVAKSIVPLVCNELQQQAPLANIESRLWQGETLQSLAESKIDLVTTIAEEVPENLYGKVMATDSYVVLFNKLHPLANKKLTIKAYLEAKHVVVKGVVDSRRQVDKVNKEFGQQRRIFATVPSFHAAMEVLANTETVITAPLHIAAKYVAKFSLGIKPLPFDLTPHQYYLFWHAKHHQDPEHKWFRELCLPLFQTQLQHNIQQGKLLLEQS